MLAKNEMIAFVATTQPEKAKAFYSDVIGLKLLEEGPFALRYSAGEITLHVQKVQQFSPHPFTSLGWKVADIHTTIAALARLGVKFERFPGMQQDDAGVWTTPAGGKVGWFKDPDGNLLSITQFR